MPLAGRRGGRCLSDSVVRRPEGRLCVDKPLFHNIHPAEFEDGWLVRPDDPLFMRRMQATLEITESVPLDYNAQCHGVLAEIRRKGVSLAIDDFGAGYSNVLYILELEPEIVKLDRRLTVGLETESRQGALVRGLVDLCHSMGARVIAEGIETVAEFKAVTELGVEFGQGFLLGRPSNPPPDLTWPHRLF
jgi:EAL domain-containing protein (putative c-di-GMP-specific phosphodiesterase class I)